MSEETESNLRAGWNNSYATAGALQIRLDTSEILDNLEANLKGIRRIQTLNESNEIVTLSETKGEPLANDEGVQHIMNQISLILNPAFVQGNWKREQYFNFLYNTHRQLAHMIMVSAPDYDIEDNNIRPIVNMLMNSIEGFVSRLVDNKERESFESTIRTSETVVNRENKQGLFK